jgi:succinate dehydrogenase / fumarate reductase cytochrome b subunit
MTGSDRDPRSTAEPGGGKPTAREPKGVIDAGRTGENVSFPDPGAFPLRADDQAAGRSDRPDRAATALRQELKAAASGGLPGRPRPSSPNIQIYRPQLTSVLSIANRITGVVLCLGSLALVAWLIAGATGPDAYAAVQGAISSGIGQVALFGFTFAFFLHLCGGLRHLVWDTVHGFELRAIYVGGWSVVAASVGLTAVAWIASAFVG